MIDADALSEMLGKFGAVVGLDASKLEHCFASGFCQERDAVPRICPLVRLCVCPAGIYIKQGIHIRSSAILQEVNGIHLYQIPWI